MAELVAHEVEVTAVDGRGGDKANHLVKSNAAMNGSVFIAFSEVPIHIGIDEAEDEGLVAHEGLVVAFSVRDVVLIGTAVGEFPEDAAGLPVLVAQFLDGLNPIVGDVHRHAVVKAITAILEGRGQTRHTAHLFCNGDGIGIDFVDKEVGQGEVADGIVVLVAVEIVTITTEGFAQSVAIIEHRGHAVETEAIEVELFQPILAIGEEEVNDFVLAIVEAKAIPSGMLATAARIEELAGVTAEVAQTLYFILNGVALHEVHDNGNAHGVRLVNQLLEFLGSAETTGGCKETAHVVTETAVVGMLLQGHNLETVVTFLSNTREDQFAKLVVRAHLLGILRHTDMAFINKEWIALGSEGFFLEDVGRLGIPYLRREYFGLLILNHAGTPSGNALTAAALPIDLHFVELSVTESVRREFEFPIIGARNPLQLVLLLFLPLVEVANKINGSGIGCPFAEYPSARGLVETEIGVTLRKIAERGFATREFFQLTNDMVVPSLDSVIEGFEPRIILDNLQSCVFLTCGGFSTFHITRF